MESRSQTTSPALFISSSSTSLSQPSKIEKLLKDSQMLHQLFEFATHADITGKVLAPISPSEMIQFPSLKEVNKIILSTSSSDATCLSELIRLLRIPLNFYLHTCVDQIPDFLSASKDLEIKMILSSENTNAHSFLSESAKILHSLIKESFPPAPIRLLMRSPELCKQLHSENLQLLDKLSCALGVAIIRYMGDNYTYHPHYSELPYQLDFIKNLIENGANLDVVKESLHHNIQTPISAAVSCHKIEILNLLVNCGANINLPVDPTYAPLTMAVECGNMQALKFLLSSGKISEEHKLGALACANKKLEHQSELTSDHSKCDLIEMIDLLTSSCANENQMESFKIKLK